MIRFSRIAFLLKEKKSWLFVGGLALVAAGLASALLLAPQPAQKSIDDLKSERSFFSFFKKEGSLAGSRGGRVSPLSGLPLSGSSRVAVAAVIDNAPDARPQAAGLSRASFIFEAPVEGGATRFLAFFESDAPAFVGPIRSLRPYFALFPESLFGALAHVGGSPAGLLAASQLADAIDIFENDDGLIVRDERYPPPHNAFLALPAARAAAARGGPAAEPAAAFGARLAAGRPVESISVASSLPAFAEAFVWDAASRSFRVFVGGEALADGPRPVAPKSLAFLWVEPRVLDDTGRVTFRLPTRSPLPATFAANGQLFEGRIAFDETGIAFLASDTNEKLPLPAGLVFMRAAEKSAVTFE